MAKVPFTAGRVSGFKCPPNKKQAFMWDATAPGLGLRVTPTGKPAYVFQSVYLGKDIRQTIGSPVAWSIPKAQEKARELQRLIDEGKDPRDLKRNALAASAARKAEATAHALTVGEVWATYIEQRRPHWGTLHYRDHIIKAAPGGEPSKRRGQTDRKTQPGPLASLMPLPLCNLDQITIEVWAAREGKTRPASARLAWRLLNVFLSWCKEQPAFAGVLDGKNPAKSKKARESLGRPRVKSDVLTREQLPAWFAHVHQIANPAIAAYLQTLLLTGARPSEVLALRWEDVNWQWKGINMRDKVEGTREIPLTPYVAALLAALPRRNQWVFSSAYALDMSPANIKRRALKAAKVGAEAQECEIKNRSADGRLSLPNTPHTRACDAAGLKGLTLHGLRRSFASLTEWLEIPAGVVAQIQGHKPSATAEKHYKRRPLDLLRRHHERIETWILEQAEVKFDPKAAPEKLRAVA
jgi:integrase